MILEMSGWQPDARAYRGRWQLRHQLLQRIGRIPEPGLPEVTVKAEGMAGPVRDVMGE